MKLRTKLMSFTAAIALSAGMAFAAIDGNALADEYLAKGYTYVEVKVGPTQTKVEAIMGDTKIEVVYDNETQAIIDSETETVEADDLGKVGVEVKTVDSDFEDGEDDDLEDDLEDELEDELDDAEDDAEDAADDAEDDAEDAADDAEDDAEDDSED